MKKLPILIGVVVAVVVALLVLRVQAAVPRDTPGFFGSAVLIADINLVFEVVLVFGLTFGFLLARWGKIEAHRYNQTIWVLVNTALVAFIMASAMREVQPESAANVTDPVYWVAWLHGLVGLFTVIAGLWLVLQMNDVLPQRLHIGWWKNLMRATLAGYWTVALIGFTTYYFWYVA